MTDSNVIPCSLLYSYWIENIMEKSLFLVCLCLTELKREIEIWRQSASRIMVVTKEEATVKSLLMQKVHQLEESLKHQLVMVG